MKEKILRDLKNLSMKLKYEKSENRISVYMTNYIALVSLLNLLDIKDAAVPLDFDLEKIMNIFNKKVRKDKKRYFGNLITTIPLNYELAQNVLSVFDEMSFYPYSIRCVSGIDARKSADYLISFMNSMGESVFKIFSSIYDENRVDYFRNGDMNGLCTCATSLNSSYITYAPKLDYFDSSIISHEIGHVIQEKVLYEHGIFSLTGTLYDEVISQFMELAYIDFIKEIDDKIFEVESSTLRTFYKNAMDLYITPRLIENGLIYQNGIDLRSFVENTNGIEILFNDRDIPIISSNLKSYSYAKSTTYFIGMLIAQHFLSNYSENKELGLRKLKEFISTSHISSFKDSIEHLGIDSEYAGLRKRIKENKTVMKWI